MSDTLTGEVKWFNKDKGFGFITTPGGDVFVHAKQLRMAGIVRPLEDGEKITFKIGKGPKGQFATDITLPPAA